MVQTELWREFLEDSTKGEIFSVTFKKVDGSTRRLVGRTGVTKGVNQPGQFDRQDRRNGILRVYDFEKQAFRSINLGRIISVCWRGKTW